MWHRARIRDVEVEQRPMVKGATLFEVKVREVIVDLEAKPSNPLLRQMNLNCPKRNDVLKRWQLFHLGSRRTIPASWFSNVVQFFLLFARFPLFDGQREMRVMSFNRFVSQKLWLIWSFLEAWVRIKTDTSLADCYHDRPLDTVVNATAGHHIRKRQKGRHTFQQLLNKFCVNLQQQCSLFSHNFAISRLILSCLHFTSFQVL